MSNFALSKTGFDSSCETLLKSYYSQDITMLRRTLLNSFTSQRRKKNQNKNKEKTKNLDRRQSNHACRYEVALQADLLLRQQAFSLLGKKGDDRVSLSSYSKQIQTETHCTTRLPQPLKQ